MTKCLVNKADVARLGLRGFGRYELAIRRM